MEELLMVVYFQNDLHQGGDNPNFIIYFILLLLH